MLGLTLTAVPSLAGPALAIATPIGTIFVNLIRMTVIPLVMSMLVANVGSMTASRSLGRVGVRAAIIAIVVLTLTAVFSILVAAPLLARLHIDQSAAMALRGPETSTGTAASAPPGLGQWIVDLVPQNVFKAASDGTMLTLIVFAVLFALALSRVPAARRDSVLRVAEGVSDAMQRLVAGILALAPIGVFALAVPLAAKLGLSAAAAVAAYIGLVVSLTLVVGAVLLYPIGIFLGGMSPGAFVALCAPAQAVAFAARSSLASLPAMVESAQIAKMPPVVSGFILPLAASIFRVGGAVAMPVGALFVARACASLSETALRNCSTAAVCKFFL